MQSETNCVTLMLLKSKHMFQCNVKCPINVEFYENEIFRTVIVTIEHHIEMMQVQVMMNLIQIVVVHMLVLLVLNHLTTMMVQKVVNVLEILHKIRPHQKRKNQNEKLLTILMMMKTVKNQILTKIQILITPIRIRIIKT